MWFCLLILDNCYDWGYFLLLGLIMSRFLCGILVCEVGCIGRIFVMRGSLFMFLWIIIDVIIFDFYFGVWV